MPDYMSRVISVLGDIPPEEFGPTLVHERILVDFTPTDELNRIKYDPNEVFEFMLPYLIEIRRLGIKGFVECSTDGLAEKWIGEIEKE